MQFSKSKACLEDAGDDVGLHPSSVLGPGVTKLLPVPLVDLQTPEYKHQCGDDREVVWDQLGQAKSWSCRKNPRPLDQQLAQVVRVAHQSPPARDNKTATFDGLKGLEVCKAWVSWVLRKLAALVLAAPVDVIAQQVHSRDGGKGSPGKGGGNADQIAGHQGW